MYCRFFFISFLSVYVQSSIANNGHWDCEKVEGQEWSCHTINTPEEVEVKTKTTATDISQHIKTVSESSIIVLPDLEPNSKPKIIPVKIIASSTPRSEQLSTSTATTQPSQTVIKKAGWDCAANNQEERWNCHLTGTDPKGKVKVIKEDEAYSFRLLDDAFDFNQEQIFEILQTQLAHDPWRNCASSSLSHYPYSQETELRNTAPVDVTADYTEVFDEETTHFSGNVSITRADQTLFSNKANYNTVSETMDAQGHVYYSEDEFSLYSESALLNLATDEARLRKALFVSPSGPTRGSADVVYRDNKFLSRYKDAIFTSCRPGNQDWAVHADRLKMNKQTGRAAAKNAWLEFKGMPMLYTPYISFPLDDRRLSGFLTPTWGSSDESGFDWVVPYYWNLAPNYDLTIWPRYMSKRGGMIGGEFRYLTEMTTGSLGLEYLPYDILDQEPRYSAVIKNTTVFMPNLISDIDLKYVSDNEYFDELNNALGLSNSRYLKSRADIAYKEEWMTFVTHLETYQTIDKNIATTSKPYQKLPQVSLDFNHSFEDWPIDLTMENEYVNFYRDGQVNGHRFNTKPSIAVPIKTAGTFITPKISLQHTQYFLTDQANNTPNSMTRTVPIASIDSGLVFEREFDSGFMHTLEPRLFYLYIPYEDQKNIPVFDSAFYDFNFSSLFRENRFSGSDRVQDANQITLATTSRLIDSKTGKERLKLSVGEIFYFRDRKVGRKVETERLSNLVAEFSGKLTESLSFTSGIQWNPDLNDIERGESAIKYNDPEGRIINLGYRYRVANLNTKAVSIIQTDSSFRWPLYDNWFGVGRWQYSLKFNSTKESFLGIEKESCCWRFRLIWRRFANRLNNALDNEMDEGIFVQLELKGLSNFGDKVDKFLEKNLKGYDKRAK